MQDPLIPQLTADEFLAWEARQRDKFELRHGFISGFAGGTLDHDIITFNTRNVLKRIFPPPCRTIGSDVKIRYAAAGFYYADAGVVCVDVAPHAVFCTEPRVVAEVLTPSTRIVDIVQKRADYRALASLEYHVIVHTQLRRVEVDTRDARDLWSTSTYDAGDAYLGSRGMPLDDIYESSSLA